jgi:hypothetical protein
MGGKPSAGATERANWNIKGAQVVVEFNHDENSASGTGPVATGPRETIVRGFEDS